MFKEIVSDVDDFIYCKFMLSRKIGMRMIGSFLYIITIMMCMATAITLLLLPIIHPMLGFMTVFVLLAILAMN